ncbi:MAG: ribonuclease H family protein [Muribaculaceae bacterium]|nr:ribonuclease H family protein [Muribaculaceae bacterium]
MTARRRFYVVWVGVNPGIYDSWEECQLQIKNYPGAKYKAFDSQTAATLAYRGDPADHIGIIKAIASHRATAVNYDAIPEINTSGIAVDGACSGVPGPMEYRGVKIATGEELFHLGPLPDGTNNVAEYLALVHALALLDKSGDHRTPVYSDSRTALAWLRNHGHRSKLDRTQANGKIFELLERADKWVQTHHILNPVLKWDTEQWGEIPADFGRK